MVECEFELQSGCYIYFWKNTLGKGMNPSILPAIGWIASLLFFHKDGFGLWITHEGWYAIKQKKPNQVSSLNISHLQT